MLTTSQQANDRCTMYVSWIENRYRGPVKRAALAVVVLRYLLFFFIFIAHSCIYVQCSGKTMMTAQSRVTSDGRHPQSSRLLYPRTTKTPSPEETQRRLILALGAHPIPPFVLFAHISFVSTDARTQLHLITNNNNIIYYCYYYIIVLNCAGFNACVCVLQFFLFLFSIFFSFFFFAPDISNAAR